MDKVLKGIVTRVLKVAVYIGGSILIAGLVSPDVRQAIDDLAGKNVWLVPLVPIINLVLVAVAGYIKEKMPKSTVAKVL